VLTQFTDVRAKTVSYDKDRVKYQNEFNSYDDKRKLATMILFILPIAAAGILIVATLFKSSVLFKVYVHLSL